MNSVGGRIVVELERMNTMLYVGIFVALKLVLNQVSRLINFSVTGQPITKGFEDIVNVNITFLVAVIAGPIIETYLAQYLFFKYLSGRCNKWLIVVMSAIFFAFMHHYNAGYIVYAFFSGLLLSTSYAIRLDKNPFVCTVLIHSMHNLAIFLINNWR